MQALGFCFFWAKPKERAPSAAASRGKPEPEAKPTIVILNAVKNLSKRSFVPQDDKKLLLAKKY